MDQLSRRDFLRFVSLLTAGALTNLFPEHNDHIKSPDNIVIILFDSMSANHLSLYGYPRETTPHLRRFANQATVYHSHYSASNFTTPGTASMLTGMYPWKHRALQYGGVIRRDLVSINPYSLLGEDFFRFFFSQNLWPDYLVGQVYKDIDRHLPLTSYSRRGNNLVYDKLGNDRTLAAISLEEFLFSLQTQPSGSSLLGYLYKSLALYITVNNQTHENYPKGVPDVEGYFSYLNEVVYEGVFSEIMNLEFNHTPYFAYFHLYSPHLPYKPSNEFIYLFRDGFLPPKKPIHPTIKNSFDDHDLRQKRRRYDQQIANVDAEFGKLIEKLGSNGVLDNSYVIVTSDHGELFERGFWGHGNLMLYEPVIKIPLLIHAPRQNSRKDIHSLTSNVDVLPTILSLAGKKIPDNLDGVMLPEFGGVEDFNRTLFSIDAVANSAFLPLKKAAIAMRKGDHKLIKFIGYDSIVKQDEFYNIRKDPEELTNIVNVDTSKYERFKEKLLSDLKDANLPFE